MWARVDPDGRSERSGCRVARQRRSARRERSSESPVPQPVRRSSGSGDVPSPGQCRLERGERDRRRAAAAPRCSLTCGSRRGGRRCGRDGDRRLVPLRRRARRRHGSPASAGSSGEGRFRAAADSREGDRTDRERPGRASCVPAVGGHPPPGTQERDGLCDSGRGGADVGSGPRPDRSAVGTEDELGSQRRRRGGRGPHLEGWSALDDFPPHHRTRRGRSPRQAIVPPHPDPHAGPHAPPPFPRQTRSASAGFRAWGARRLPGTHVTQR